MGAPQPAEPGCRRTFAQEQEVEQRTELRRAFATRIHWQQPAHGTGQHREEETEKIRPTQVPCISCSYRRAAAEPPETAATHKTDGWSQTARTASMAPPDGWRACKRHTRRTAGGLAPWVRGQCGCALGLRNGASIRDPRSTLANAATMTASGCGPFFLRPRRVLCWDGTRSAALG